MQQQGHQESVINMIDQHLTLEAKYTEGFYSVHLKAVWYEYTDVFGMLLVCIAFSGIDIR